MHWLPEAEWVEESDSDEDSEESKDTGDEESEEEAPNTAPKHPKPGSEKGKSSGSVKKVKRCSKAPADDEDDLEPRRPFCRTACT